MSIIARIKQNYLNGKTAKNIATLITGTAFAQVITLVTSPILTRLYSPKDFGVLALFGSIMNITSVIACGRYEIAIVLPKKRADAINLLALSLLVVSGWSLLALLLVLVFHRSIGEWFGLDRSMTWILLIPINILTIGVFQALNYWLTRNHFYQELSRSRLGQSLTSSVVQVGTGAFSTIGAVGLLTGQVLGQVTSVVVLASRVFREELKTLLLDVSWANIKEQAVRYKKNPIFLSWPALLDSLTQSLPVLFLTHFYGAEPTGYFSLAMRVLNIPISVIGSSVSQVILPKFANQRNEDGQLSDVMERMLRKLMGFGILIVIGAQVFPFVFQWVFGAEWETAGHYAQLLAFSVALRFVVSPLSGVLLVCERQEVLAYWQVAYILSTALMLGLSLFFSNPLVSLYFLIANDLLLYSVYLVLILKVTNSKLRRAIFPARA